MARTVKVWEVLYDTEGEGPAGDGTVIARFRAERDAKAFAARQTCYGNPARATSTDAPRHVAERWGMA